MEHREETDLGSEMLGVEGNLQKSPGTGPEQQIVEELLVLQQEWRELVGQGKDATASSSFWRAASQR